METNIASGPVIIEDNKVLLDRETKDGVITPWYFPGGGVDSAETLEEACRREVKEELGIEIEIIKQLKTTETIHKGKIIKLNHFLAKRIGEINPGVDIAEWAWHDINNLPPNCAENVYEIINDYKNMT